MFFWGVIKWCTSKPIMWKGGHNTCTECENIEMKHSWDPFVHSLPLGSRNETLYDRLSPNNDNNLQLRNNCDRFLFIIISEALSCPWSLMPTHN